MSSSVLVLATTTAVYTVEYNGYVTTFTSSSSASSSGDYNDVDQVVHQAGVLSNAANFVTSHKLLAQITIQSPLNIYANQGDISFTSNTTFDITNL